MKKYLFIVLTFIVAANSYALESGLPPDGCLGCHGLPPGLGHDVGSYNPGAHAAHNIIACDLCHVDGKKMDHINKIITLNESIMYSSGTAVAWPGPGGGSCGSDKTLRSTTGCHIDTRAQKCFWLPGKACYPLKK